MTEILMLVLVPDTNLPCITETSNVNYDFSFAVLFNLFLLITFFKESTDLQVIKQSA